MKELIITDNHTKELLVTASNVTEWQIYRGVHKTERYWCLSITYFDEDFEQDIRDSMRICEASSDKWKDDLTVQWSEQ